MKDLDLDALNISILTEAIAGKLYFLQLTFYPLYQIKKIYIKLKHKNKEDKYILAELNIQIKNNKVFHLLCHPQDMNQLQEFQQILSIRAHSLSKCVLKIFDILYVIKKIKVIDYA